MALVLVGVVLAVALLVGQCLERGLWRPSARVQSRWMAQAMAAPAGLLGLWGVLARPDAATALLMVDVLGLMSWWVLAPQLLAPLLRVVRQHRLDSLAALLAHRYASPGLGRLLAVWLLAMAWLATVAVGLLLHRLLGQQPALTLLVGGLVASAVLWAQSTSGQPLRHPAGLMVAGGLAVVKLLAVLGLTVVVLVQAFAQPDAFIIWLDQQADALPFVAVLHHGGWLPLMLAASFWPLLVPLTFQAALVEPLHPEQLRVQRLWGFLGLLPWLLALPLLWAGSRALAAQGAEVWAATPPPLLQGCLLLVATSALASCLWLQQRAVQRLAARVVWRHRPVIWSWPLFGHVLWLAGVAGGVWALASQPLGHWLMVLAGGLLVPLPLLAGFWWPRLNRHGALLALGVGAVGWLVLLVLPRFFVGDVAQQILLPWLARFDPLKVIVFNALLELAALVLASGLLVQSSREQGRARDCLATGQLPLWQSVVRTPLALRRAVVQLLGEPAACGVLAPHGLADGLDHRALPGAVVLSAARLNLVRTQVLHRLIPPLGWAQAQARLDAVWGHEARLLLAVPVSLAEGGQSALQHQAAAVAPVAEDAPHAQPPAAALKALSGWHRQLLHGLPVGVCAVDASGCITAWNPQMVALTGQAEAVVGWRLQELGQPWGELLQRFLSQSAGHALRQPVGAGASALMVNLHRADVPTDALAQRVIVVENVTQTALLEDRLAHQDRLAAMGRLVAGVAHEIGNPVAGIHAVAQNLLLDFDDAELRETAQQIIGQTERIRDIMGALVGYARTDPHDPERWEILPLRALVEDALRLIRLARRRELRVRLAIGADLQVSCYPPHLRQVLINLLANALDATAPDQAVVPLSISAQSIGSRVQLELEDFGQGLPDDAPRERLFEPFFTTKPAGEGTGLGLSLVQGLVRSHGGKIQLIDKRDYDQGTGVIVQLTLPLSDSATHLDEPA